MRHRFNLKIFIILLFLIFSFGLYSQQDVVGIVSYVEGKLIHKA